MGNKRPNRRSSRRRGRRRGKGNSNSQKPEQQTTGDQTQDSPSDGAAQLKGIRSLERLRHRVEEAAREVERLRKENADLLARLKEAEERPVLDVEGAIVGFDEEPEVLRKKVTGFIEAIDQYLDQVKADRGEA